MHRFFFVCPKPARNRTVTILSAPPSIVTFPAFCLFNRLLHDQRRIYTFSSEAAKFIHGKIDLYQDLVEAVNQFDFFLS